MSSKEGCLILFYGNVSESGKTSLAVSLASSVGKQVYVLERVETIGTDAIQIDLEKLRELLNSEAHVHVIDNDTDLLHSRSNFNNFLPRPWLMNYLKSR